MPEKFFKIRNYVYPKDKDCVSIEFYGDIVADSFSKSQNEDTCPIEVKNILAEANGKELHIYMNSCGGDILAGYAIGNALKNYTGKTVCHVDGLAASIAGYIAMCSDEIYMPENSYLMLHKPLSTIYGHADALIRRAELLNQMQQGIISAFLAKARDGVGEEQINEFINADYGNGTWFTGLGASKYFKINLTEPIKAVAYIGNNIESFKNTPQNLIKNPSKNVYRCKMELLKLKGVK